jgi:CheY-like chemotaxis protein
MNILHFEYSEFFRNYIRDLVEKSGHHYLCETQGKSLFNTLAMHEVDIIITGLELSDMKGEELIQQLQTSKFKHIPVVVVTSSAIDNLNARLKGVHFDDFILKENLNFDSFTKCIDRLEDNVR